MKFSQYVNLSNDKTYKLIHMKLNGKFMNCCFLIVNTNELIEISYDAYYKSFHQMLIDNDLIPTN